MTTLLLIALFSALKTTYTFFINKKKQLNLLLFLLCAIPSGTYAQQESPFVKASNIYSVLQDNKDFIWLCGQNGLYRFDGESIINFSNKENGWFIPFNWINSISKHGNQLILATESKGLWLFDTETGKTQPIDINTPTNTFYQALYHKGSYYAVSMAPQHLYRHDMATNKTTLIAKNIQNNQLFASKNRIYFNDNEKLFYLDSSLNNNQIQRINEVNEKIVTAVNINEKVIMASENYLFSINDNGNVVKKTTVIPISVITAHNNQNAIFSVDRLGKIIKWEATTLHKLDSSFGVVKSSRYQVLLHENSGVLLLGDNRGIQQLTEATVKNIPVTFDTQYNVINTEVYQQTVYIGSYGVGVHTLSPFNGHDILPITGLNERLSHNAKKTIDLLAIDNELYIATFDGLWLYHKENDHVEKINLTIKNETLVILKLSHKDNLLYIATDGRGLIIYDLTKKIVIQHIDENAGLSSPEVIDALPLANGDIWLATATGIDVVNRQTQVVKNITKQTSTKFISLLKIDNRIFTSTKGNGIQVYNLEGELLAKFAKGINFNQLSLVDGSILASAKPGLYKINPDNYQFSMLTNTSDFSFSDNAFIFNQSLYISNNTGILQLPRATAAVFHPKIYISKTTVSGESYLLNKLIKIDSGNDVITLDLASLDYRPGLKKQYQYTLNGQKWNQINGNQLTLTGLASGEYNIEIMATNSLGQWSDFKAFTNIKVAYPWYWTPNIRVLYSVAFLGIMLLTAWLLYLRSKSIAHIHHILKSDLNNQGKISLQVKRNLTLAKDLINQQDLVQGQLLLSQCLDDLNSQQSTPEPNTLDGKALSVAMPFFANYLQHKYQVNLTYQLNIQDDSLNYELEADLYRVIFEAITCVILKGSGRNFKVMLQIFKNKVWLNIYDDKQGFTNFNSKINFDISMYYIRQIANKHQGSINSFNEQDDGSQLVLSLPLT